MSRVFGRVGFRDLLAFALRCGLGGLLVAAGLEKLEAFAWWSAQVHAMKLGPERWSAAAAAIVAGAEVSAGAFLVLGLCARAALLAAAFLYAVFAAAMATVLATGTAETCACFGPSSSFPVSVNHVLLNVVAVLLLVAIYAFGPGRLTADEFARSRFSPASA